MYVRCIDNVAIPSFGIVRHLVPHFICLMKLQKKKNNNTENNTNTTHSGKLRYNIKLICDKYEINVTI